MPFRNRGVLKYFKTTKAKNYFDYALKLDPNHEKTLINMSQLLIFEEKDDLPRGYTLDEDLEPESNL